jgi:hypothetical protein
VADSSLLLKTPSVVVEKRRLDNVLVSGLLSKINLWRGWLLVHVEGVPLARVIALTYPLPRRANGRQRLKMRLLTGIRVRAG